MKIWAAILAIAICSSPLAWAQSADATAEALIAKSKSIPEALRAKDVKALNDLLASDFTVVSSEGEIHDRAEGIGAAGEGVLRDFMFYNPQVKRVDDNSAAVTYNLIVTMPEGDDSLAPRYQKISDLWVHAGGDWRLKFEQATPLRSVD